MLDGDDEPGDWSPDAGWTPPRPRPAELDDWQRHAGPEYWMFKQILDDEEIDE